MPAVSWEGAPLYPTLTWTRVPRLAQQAGEGKSPQKWGTDLWVHEHQTLLGGQGDLHMPAVY